MQPHSPTPAEESQRANRSWWNQDAADYHQRHGDYLGIDDPNGTFIWCPEAVYEDDYHLLGEDIAGKHILEIGCGSAPCSRWLSARGAKVVAFDISEEMLRYGQRSMTPQTHLPLIQASAEDLPFATASFDIAFSSFGAIPFVANSQQVMHEVARVLRPGGRFVFSITHPMRWIFRDEPDEQGLVAVHSYFNRSGYIERDEAGTATYAEHHRTLGDRIRELRAAGFVLEDLIEPVWPEGLERIWGQWSPLRGEIFPGTAIFVTTLAR